MPQINDLRRVTIDQARGAFEQHPSREAAADFITVATRYWYDHWLDDAGYQDAMKLVSGWLSEAA